MGSDSDGPLAVAWDPKPDDPDIYHSLLSFVDPGTLEVLRCDRAPLGGFWFRSRPTPSGGSLVASGRHLQIRASAVGNLFGIWTPRAGANVSYTVFINGGSISGGSGNRDVGYVAPATNGKGIPHGSS